jgi:hypothetical protein
MSEIKLPEFKAFDSIPRLKRTCVITEKLDGTNAQVWNSDDGQTIAAGSRNRWITPEADNFGFAKWVADHAEELKLLGPGHHYGEWWGAGIQRRYGLSEKRFSLFNVKRWTAPGAVLPACCSLVPVLYDGDFSTDRVDSILASLARDGSKAAPGFMQPEGVVVYLPQARSLFKVTLGDDGHKSAKVTTATANAEAVSG